ncbi:MAG: DUF2752 domain-containing protein, partial [Cyclobacteriaceae bacterium]
MNRIRLISLELYFWPVALLSLLAFNPVEDSHFSICPIDRMGFTWCPGCGLGRSLGLLMRGDW